MAKVKSTDADIILIGGWAKDVGRIVKQAKELGIDENFVSLAGGIGHEVIDIAGEAADEKIIYVVEFDTESEEENSVEFRRKYLEEYGEKPDVFSAMGYDAIHIVLKILEKCGEYSECIKDELYLVQDYHGVSGIISFDEYGDVHKEMNYVTIRDGEFVKY